MTLPVPTEDDVDFARETLGPDASNDDVSDLAQERLDRDRRETVVQAEGAIREFEVGLRHGDNDRGLASLRRATRVLAPQLPENQRASLLEAVDALIDVTDSSDTRRAGKVNILHAEVVDAVSDTPSRATIRQLTQQVTTASGDLDDAHLLHDIGRGSQEDITIARAVETSAINALNVAQGERRDATLTRVTQGRPTIYDLQDAQTRANTARLKRRAAVNTADAARQAYVQTASDDPDFDRRWLRADEMTRREGDAEDAYSQATRDLEDANSAWHRMRSRGN